MRETPDPGDTPGPGGPSGPRPGGGGWDLLEGPPERSAVMPGEAGGGQPAGHPSPDERGSEAVPWSGRDIAVILLLIVGTFFAAVFIITALLDIIFQAVPGIDRETLAESPAVISALMVLQWIITLAVPLTYFKIRGYSIGPAILGFRRTAPVAAGLWLLLVLIATSIFGQVYDSIIQSLFGESQLPSEVPSQDVTSLYGTSVLAIVLTFIAVALVTPVVEELFFRGIVHRGLEQSMGFLPGAVLSSFIFALAHLDYRLYVPIFGLGFGFAYLVHRTGSIWPSVAGHFIINSLGVVAQYAVQGDQ